MTCDPRREEKLEKDLLLETLCPTLTRSKTVNIWKQRDYKKIFNKLSVAMTADFKAKKLTENVQENDTEANEAKHKVSYTTYSERWVLIPNWMWTWFDSCLRQKILTFELFYFQMVDTWNRRSAQFCKLCSLDRIPRSGKKGEINSLIFPLNQNISRQQHTTTCPGRPLTSYPPSVMPQESPPASSPPTW